MISVWQHEMLLLAERNDMPPLSFDKELPFFSAKVEARI